MTIYVVNIATPERTFNCDFQEVEEARSFLKQLDEAIKEKKAIWIDENCLINGSYIVSGELTGRD